MSSYVLACIWGFAIFGSLIGWGRLVGLALLGLDRRSDTGHDLAWGLSATIALGGWLNLARIISSEILIGYVVLGLVLAAALGTPRPARPGRWFHDEPEAEADPAPSPSLVRRVLGLAAWGALGCLAITRFAASAQLVELCPSDDPVAYLLFPVRMLSEGSLGDDPFNNRRLISSLGGLAFLQAMVMSATDCSRVALADSGLGLLAALAAAVGLARSRGVPAPIRLVPAALILLDPFPASNLSSFILPVPLCLSLYRLMSCQDEKVKITGSWGRCVAMALVGSALASLKSSMIPLVAATLAVDALIRVRITGGRSLLWLAAVATLGLTFTAPWMMSLRASSGTYLYPILGAGTHGRQYGTFFEPNHDFTKWSVLKNLYQIGSDGQSFAAGLLVLAGLVIFRRTRRLRTGDLAIAAGWLTTLGLMATMFEFKDTIRYAHGLTSAMAVIFAVRLLEAACLEIQAPAVSRSPGPLLAVIMVSLGCGLAVGGQWEQCRTTYRKAVVRIQAGVSGAGLASDDDHRRYLALQDAVPPHTPVLTRLSQGQLLDFRRNPIYVADWPGGASPAPGLPCFQGPEPLAGYLLASGVRYVAYSYADQCNFPRVDHDYRTFTLWDRVACLHAYDFQDNLAALMTTRQRLYDDGRLVMLDLARKTDLVAGRPRTRLLVNK